MKQLINEKPLKRRGVNILSCMNPAVAMSDSIEYQKVALREIFAKIGDSTQNSICKTCNGTGYIT